MTIRVAAFACLVLAVPVTSPAQLDTRDSSTRDPREVQPERPTVATHAGTVAQGWLEIETGLERDHYSGGEITWSIPTNLKIGAGPRTQVNVIASGLLGTAANSSARGLGDITLGLKYRLLDAAPVVRDFAVLPSVKIPSASETRGLGSGTTDVSLLLISSRSIGGTALDINVGATRHFGGASGTPSFSSVWTVSAAIPVSGPIGWAAEVFGFPGTSGEGGVRPIVAILTGPTWQPRKWLAVDAGVIEPAQGPQPRAYYAGLVWNIGRIW